LHEPTPRKQGKFGRIGFKRGRCLSLQRSNCTDWEQHLEQENYPAVAADAMRGHDPRVGSEDDCRYAGLYLLTALSARLVDYSPTLSIPQLLTLQVA